MFGRFAVLTQRGPFSRTLLSYNLDGVPNVRPGSWYLVPFHHDIAPGLLVDTEPDTSAAGTLLPALACVDALGIYPDLDGVVTNLRQSLERQFVPWDDALAVVRFLSENQGHNRQRARLTVRDPAALLRNIQAVAGSDDAFARSTTSLRLLLIGDCTPCQLPTSLWKIPTRDRSRLYQQGVIVDAACAADPSANFVALGAPATPELVVGSFARRLDRVRFLVSSVVTGSGSAALITSSESLTTAYEAAIREWKLPVFRWPSAQRRKSVASRTPGIWLSTRLFSAAILPEVSLAVLDLGVPGEWLFYWQPFSQRSLVQLMCELSAKRMIPCVVGASVPTLTVLDACGTTPDALPIARERVQQTTRYEIRKAGGTASGIRQPSRILLEQTTRLLRETYDKTLDSLLLLNIHGLATLIECVECGYTATCPVCGNTLTLSAERSHLFCKQCGHSESSPDVCPNCHGAQLRSRGYGLDRLKRELGQTFPLSAIMPADIGEIERPHPAAAPFIYLGTYADVQIIPLLRPQLVVFPDVSVGLHHPVFDNLEQLFAVIRGAGSEAVPGAVVVQLDRRTVALRQALEKQPLREFLMRESAQREELRMPPFSRQFSIQFPVRSTTLDSEQLRAQLIDTLDAEAASPQGLRVEVLRTARESRIVSAEFRVDRTIVAPEQRVERALSHISLFRNAVIRIY